MNINILPKSIILSTTEEEFEIKSQIDSKKITLFIENSIKSPLLFLVTLEKMLQEKGFLELELVVSKTNINLVDFLIHSTYLISNGNFETITFTKQISQEKRIRLSLTENCNYRCFFCHEEGMDMNTTRGKKSEQEICNLLLELKQKKYNAITFTGGEPLIEKKALLNYLTFMKDNDYLPTVSIVTNGYLIDDDFINAVKQYPGKLKFNVSLHSTDPETYISIVNPKNLDNNAFSIVYDNLLKLKEHNINFKLNFVLLKKMNTDISKIKHILDFAHEVGAYGVKFLELLITEKLDNHFDQLFTLDSLKESLGDLIILTNTTYRRDEYRYLPNNMIIEFQKCTCANGCSNCPLDRAVNITPQMDYYPCFSISSNKIHITSDNLEESLKKGERVIEGFIQKYKDSSPILIKNAKIISKKKEYCYISSATVAELETEIKKYGFRLDRKRKFKDYYYLQENPSNYNFQKVIKLSQNTQDIFYREIVSERHFNSEDSSISTHYLTKSKIVNDKNNYDLLMKHLGYSDKIIFNWTYLIHIKNKDSITICENLDSGKIFILSQKPLTEKQYNDFKVVKAEKDYCAIVNDFVS